MHSPDAMERSPADEGCLAPSPEKHRPGRVSGDVKRAVGRTIIVFVGVAVAVALLVVLLYGGLTSPTGMRFPSAEHPQPGVK